MAELRNKPVLVERVRLWWYPIALLPILALFYAGFTVDDTGTEKPDPAFFEQVFAFVEKDGGSRDQILHVAQSQYHDIGVARELGYKVCWIERRKGFKGFGGTPVPKAVTKPDFHFASLGELADAVERG